MNAPFLIDPRVNSKLAWLARASARFELVQSGEMDIDEAFDGLVVYLSCPCEREIVQRWERADALRRAS